ncbi:EAL domain-containing protein [Clostridium sp. WILCCON 0269]|uniref:EAL domain-containing protein n=1 Tax=Candidatus Clostridium eludens TaxID=3381663 RepID=A0ABW8SEK6_9CLOT
MRNLNKMVNIFSKIDESFKNNPLFISVRRGLTYMIPLLLTGSMALVFLSLPIPAYQSMMRKIFGVQWQNIFWCIRDGTFNILSLSMVLCTSYSYVIEFREIYAHNVSPIIVCSVSLCSFIMILGIGKENFSIENFGVVGIFIAVVVAVISSMLFLKLSSLDFFKIKAFTDGANSAFNYAVTSIYPALITIVVFAILNQVLISIFGIADIQNFIYNSFSGIFFRIKSPFWNGILFIFLIHVFWFLGMHGSNILEPVAQSIFVPALAVNQTLINSGQAPTEIFTKTFFDTFVLMGGCGTILCLIGAILITGKYKNQRRLAKLSIIPVIFNINELVVFGIPIVLNPVYIIPFLCIPIILTMSSYLAMYSGLVPYTVNLVEWTTPIFLSGYISTNSIRGSMLQLFNLILGILCYIPFVKLSENVSCISMKNNLKKVYDMFKKGEEQGKVYTFLTRHDEIGNISRFLTADLEHDLENDKVMLFYQPQIDYEGNVFGAEALLRWKHDVYGYIYAPLIVALALEAQFVDKLGYWILDKACGDLREMNKLGLENITISVNMSAVQLQNECFIRKLEEIIKKHGIRPNKLEIEITEQIALESSKEIINRIISIKKLGVKLAMDDLGMGHSSLMYLKEYEFDTVKLDGSLVREILYNNNCCNIIESIIFLGKLLNYSVIAEYVEEEEQISVLHELGCNRYQGHLYSKALPYNNLIQYILSKDTNKSQV